VTITAKFSSNCPDCGNRIEAGTQVNWTPGSKATHITCPAKAAAPVQETVSADEIGVYVMTDGSIVKVQESKANKGRTYAKVWISDVTGERMTLDSDGSHKGRYEFAAGLIYKVASEGRRMSLDEAKQFITIFRQCARCSRKLSAKKSVEDGIGPVCIKYFTDGTTAASLMGITKAEDHKALRESAAQAAGYTYDEDSASPRERFVRETLGNRAWVTYKASPTEATFNKLMVLFEDAKHQDLMDQYAVGLDGWAA